MPDWWCAYLGLGAFVGFIAGLLGIGGGAAMVPVLAFIFAAKGFAPSQIVHLALGTAITTILFTSASSVYAHHRHRAILWPTVARMTPGVVAGTAGGALLAGVLSVRLLAIIFMLLITWSASNMLFGKRSIERTSRTDGTFKASAIAAAIGIISSLTATGGGSLVVTYLTAQGIRIQSAIATAAAIGWPLAAAGASGYVITGLQRQDLPTHSLGYVYLPALGGIVMASMLFAPLGARVAHRLSAKRLKQVFALILLALAGKMLVDFF